MKRRDFITKFITLSSCAMTAGAFGLLRFQREITVKKTVACKGLPRLDGASIVSLPENPEAYVSMMTIKVGQTNMPKICGNGELIECSEDDFQITKPGVYTVQYLGPFYGWRVS